MKNRTSWNEKTHLEYGRFKGKNFLCKVKRKEIIRRKKIILEAQGMHVFRKEGEVSHSGRQKLLELQA